MKKYILLHRLPFKKEIKIEGVYESKKEVLHAKIPFLISFKSFDEWIDIVILDFFSFVFF